MIPKITAGGCSFKGAFRYYMHDKGLESRERVAWTHTENLLTDDPDKVWKVMAWTAKEAERLKEASGQKMTGRKLTKPVFAYSLSWHPEQDPDKAHMLATAKQSLKALGFTEHETIIIAHRDEPQKHVHIIVNRVHPVNGIAASTGNSKLTLSDFAHEYERNHGKVYCPQRKKNHQKRSEGEKPRYCDPVVVNAWNAADNGQSFAAALSEQGYVLCQGRKRLVIVDRYGQTFNPLRQLDKVRAKEFHHRIKDLDLSKLPDATSLARQVQAKNLRRYRESLRYEKWSSEATRRREEQHKTETTAHCDRSRERVMMERDRLEKYYELRTQKKEIQELNAKVQNPSLWKKIFGGAGRDKAKLDILKLNYKNAVWRTHEGVGKVQSEDKTALDRLLQKQALEKRYEAERIAARRPRDYADENERRKILDSLRKRGSDKSRGPSLGR